MVIINNNGGYIQVKGNDNKILCYNSNTLKRELNKYSDSRRNYKFYCKLITISKFENLNKYNKDINYEEMAKDNKSKFIKLAYDNALESIDAVVELELYQNFHSKTRLALEEEKVEMLDAWGYETSKSKVENKIIKLKKENMNLSNF
jgi:hypothetical protein